jgi:hypothetical protein
MKPTLRERQTASSVSLNSATSIPSMKIFPDVGLSMPAMRLRSVVLPEPDGPMKAMNSPWEIARLMLRKTGISRLSR